ncbi:MAG: hypothetical protein ACPIOQ_61925 [Promethearchaeia archaeon]
MSAALSMPMHLIGGRCQAYGYKDQAILRQALWDEPAVRLYVLPATWQVRLS